MTRLTLFLFLFPLPLLAQLPPAAGSFKTESTSGRRYPGTRNVIDDQKEGPPRITYGATRESKAWVTTTQGRQVAVDDGITWQGRKVYLTLTFDLLVVDTTNSKTLWSDSVGAFWDTITFKNRAAEGQPPVWTVVLSSSRQPGYEQPYELETGKKLPLRGNSACPEGTPFTPRKVWSGSGGKATAKTYQLVKSAEEWNKLKSELFGDSVRDLPTARDLDFTKEMLLVCYAGKASNWMGIDVDLAVANDSRVLLQLHRQTYQSFGQTKEEYPYGVVVLPRSPGKEVVLEYNRQNLIGGPPMWKEFMRLK
ncbi:MAG: hypothetical protein U0796_14940 [Gemmatales bacterium]